MTQNWIQQWKWQVKRSKETSASEESKLTSHMKKTNGKMDAAHSYLQSNANNKHQEAAVSKGSRGKKLSLMLSNRMRMGSEKPKENHTTKSFIESDVEIKDTDKQGSACISYEDFLKQTLQEKEDSDQKGQSAKKAEKSASNPVTKGNICAQISKLKEGKKKNNTKPSMPLHKEENISAQKQAMSYSEFLGMFKQPSPRTAIEDTNAVDEEETEAEMGNMPEGESARVSKCRSIASYFTKVEGNSSKKSQSTDTITLTVVAEVHSKCKTDGSHTSNQLLEKAQKRSAHSSPEDNSFEIVLLSSETIFDVESHTQKDKASAKKRKSEEASISVEGAKKHKINENHEREKLSSQHETEKSSLSDAGSPQVQCAPISFCKTLQSTLCFGKNATVTKREVKEVEVNDRQKEPLNKRLKVNTTDTESKDLKELVMKDYVSVVPNQTESQSDRKMSDTKQVKAVVRPTQLFSQKETVNLEKTVTEDMMECPMITSGLRRSSRIAQSVQTVKDIEVMEIADDDDDDDRKRETRKGGKLGKHAKYLPATENQCQENLKKSRGKLAPIFNLGKMIKDEPKASPVVDVEKEQLKRQFLMSGIPEELKRRIASVSNTIATMGYPPFPTFSHIQQLPLNKSTAIDVVAPKCAYLGDAKVPEYAPDQNLTWSKLEWGRLEKSVRVREKMFERFVSHQRIQDHHIDELFRELHNFDNKFAFRRTYSHLVSKLASVESSGDNKKSLVSNYLPSAHCDDSEVVIVDDTSLLAERQELKSTADPGACLWTDLHQSENSEQIVGNTRVIKQLKHWLEEWKTIMQKEFRKANKCSSSAGKSRSKGGWSDDADFTDSDEEESTLCNTMLIIGPHGIGKTATVYALAQELGYKVFEVNSSSLRSGKQLLSQLEEATQSHQVAQNKSKMAPSIPFLDTGSSQSKKVEIEKSKANHSKLVKKSASALAFANLFKTPTTLGKDNENAPNTAKRKLDDSASRSSQAKSAKPSAKRKQGEESKLGQKVQRETSSKILAKEEERSERKRRCVNKEDDQCAEKALSGRMAQVNKSVSGTDSLQENDYSSASGSLNLTSVSLILFDEVDVVFEEDKGFLATVQHFMMSTKIPIILTSTESSFHSQLSAHHERVVFKHPPLTAAASFLCTVGLAHGVRISHSSVVNAMRCLKGDMRRCLLYLQYWCESGGGRVQVSKALDLELPQSASSSNAKSEKAGLNVKENKRVSRGVISDDSSDSHFLCIGHHRGRSRQVVCSNDTDDSNSRFSVVSMDNVIKHSESAIESSPLPLKGRKKNSSLKRRNGRNFKQKTVDDKSTTLKGIDQDLTTLPLQHQAFEESLLGLQSCSLSATTLMKSIQAYPFSLDQATQVCYSFSQSLNTNVLYHVALHCLPLPKCDMPVVHLTLPAQSQLEWLHTSPQRKPRRRILRGSWLDSDSSDEDGTKSGREGRSNGTPDNIPVSSSTTYDKSRERSSNKEESNSNQKTAMEKEGSQLCASVLSALSSYYDSASFLDCLEQCLSSAAARSGRGGRLCPGMGDKNKQLVDPANHHLADWLEHVSSAISVCSTRHLVNKVEALVHAAESHEKQESQISKWTDECPDQYCDAKECPAFYNELCLPVGREIPDLLNLADKEVSHSDSVLKNVSHCLGSGISSSDRTLHLEYLPYLRQICRSESGRHQAKTQRRFHHYLDNIGLSLKESTIASLNSAYTVTAADKMDL